MDVNIDSNTILATFTYDEVKDVETIINSISSDYKFTLTTTVSLYEELLFRYCIRAVLDSKIDKLSNDITYKLTLLVGTDKYNLTLRHVVDNDADILKGWIYGLSLLQPYD